MLQIEYDRIAIIFRLRGIKGLVWFKGFFFSF